MQYPFLPYPGTGQIFFGENDEKRSETSPEYSRMWKMLHRHSMLLTPYLAIRRSLPQILEETFYSSWSFSNVADCESDFRRHSRLGVIGGGESDKTFFNSLMLIGFRIMPSNMPTSNDALASVSAVRTMIFILRSGYSFLILRVSSSPFIPGIHECLNSTCPPLTSSGDRRRNESSPHTMESVPTSYRAGFGG